MRDSALYSDILKKILASIETGEYLENEPLPTERFLCEKYHVSRSTIRQALMYLKQEGFIYTVPGSGSFICPRTFTLPLGNQIYSFTDIMKKSNLQIQNEIISHDLIPADQPLARITGYPKGTLFHKLLRLRSAKEYSLMLETTYLPQSRFFKLDLAVLSNDSLYDFLGKTYNLKIDRASEKFSPIMPRPQEKSLLRIPDNLPCMLLERFSYEEDLLVEYTKSIIRGDKFTFHIDFNQT